MHFKFTLAQLFLAMTVWTVCLGTIPTFFPDWVHGLLAVAAVIAIMVVCVRCQTIAGSAVLLLPLVCALNWSSFNIGLGHAFGETGMVMSLLGPIADWVSWPVIVVQNSVPLDGDWDTLVGIATISLLETGGLILLITIWRKLIPYKPMPFPG